MRVATATLALLFSTAALPSAIDRIAETPCLMEYRLWLFTEGKKPSTFETPNGFSEEQCRHAAAVNEEVQAAADREWELAQKKPAKVRRSTPTSLPGARIGMTPEQVINQTNWGKPSSVRRTTTKHGVSEQWIYPGQQYLYFDDGRLSAIQN